MAHLPKGQGVFLPPFKAWLASNIPAVYDNTMTYYEELCALIKYLQDVVIPALNHNAEAVTAIATAVEQLQKYVDEYFDNLDVQEEINNKLDQMAEDGILSAMMEGYFQPVLEQIDRFEDRVDGQIAVFNNKLNQFDASPVAVDSTSDMTDHNQIYVNTTDGKWYYWSADDSAFVIGGTYQSTQLDSLDDQDMKPKGLTTMPIDFYTGYNLRTDYVNERWGWSHDAMQLQQTGNIAYGGSVSENNKCVTTFIPANSYVRIHKSNTSGRFRIGVCNTRPVNGVVCTILYDVNTATDYCFFNTSYSWLVVYYSHTTDVADPDTVIDVYVDNRNKILEAIRPDNMVICEKHNTSDLFDPYNFVNGVGCDQMSGYYQWRYINQYRSYKFILAPNTTYNIKKIGTSNRFRVCLWRAEPIPADPGVGGLAYFNSHPSVVVVDDNDEDECTFASGDYLYCTITYSNASESGVTFEITTPDEPTATYYQIKRDYLKEYMLTKVDGGYQILDGVDANNSLWLQWNARLSYGMTPQTAYVPCYFNSQIFVDGTIIANNTGSKNNNRWGYHVFEGYSVDEHSRITMLLDKNTEHDKATAEMYYYTGSGTHANAYGYFKLGSDVKYHSFMFDRDEMIAEGQISCNNPVRLANIDPDSDCIFTYDTVEEADTALGTGTVNNAKAVRGIQLKNAQNGTMWYDYVRNKVVIKVNGKWHDLNTTEVPEGTYNF